MAEEFDAISLLTYQGEGEILPYKEKEMLLNTKYRKDRRVHIFLSYLQTQNKAKFDKFVIALDRCWSLQIFSEQLERKELHENRER